MCTDDGVTWWRLYIVKYKCKLTPKEVTAGMDCKKNGENLLTVPYQFEYEMLLDGGKQVSNLDVAIFTS